MVQSDPIENLSIQDLKVPFEDKLDPNNRWIILAHRIPWERLSNIYKKSIPPCSTRSGQNIRLIIGVLIIKYQENLSFEKITEGIEENFYIQYFLGFKEFNPNPIRNKSDLISSLNEIEILFKKYKDGKRNERYHKFLTRKMEVLGNINKLVFRNSNGFIFINPEDVIYMKADGNYTIFFFGNDQNRTVNCIIGRIHSRLDPIQFIRVKRSYVINCTYLSEINTTKKTCKLLSKNGEELYCPISKEQISELSKKIKDQRMLVP